MKIKNISITCEKTSDIITCVIELISKGDLNKLKNNSALLKYLPIKPYTRTNTNTLVLSGNEGFCDYIKTFLTRMKDIDDLINPDLVDDALTQFELAKQELA